VPTEPRQGPLHNPAPLVHDKPLLPRSAAHQFQGHGYDLTHPGLEVLTPLPFVRQYFRQPCTVGGQDAAQGVLRPFRVRDARRMHPNPDQRPPCIHHDVPLASLGFFLGRQSWREQLGFERGEIGRRIASEAALGAAGFVPVGEGCTQGAPPFQTVRL
jgi:hypothetical protein